MAWYRKSGPLRADQGSPVVAILLYRKHVITQQPYLTGLIQTMEAQGVTPVPIFINGIEAHTVVRSPHHPHRLEYGAWESSHSSPCIETTTSEQASHIS